MGRPFRVLFVSLHFARLGGLESYNVDVAKSLTRLGAEVSSVSTLTSESGYYDGIPTLGLLPKRTAIRRLYQRYWQAVLSVYLLGLGLRCDYDLVIAGHLIMLPQVAAFARRRGIPYWVFVFGIEAWSEWRRGARQAMVRCDRIISISRFTADAVRRRLNNWTNRIEIIPPMVDVNIFAPRVPRVPKVAPCVLTVGRLSASERYKGHDMVISAMPYVMEKLERPIDYWIVGDGDDRPRLQAMARQLSLSERVKFLGRVSTEDLIEIYNACDVFTMPSRVEERAHNAWAGEGFGIVYIEAAACGKPVVAANQGGAVEAVQHGVTGLLVNPTEKDVAEALTLLLTDEEMRERMGKAGREFVVENFSQRMFDRRWEEVVASLQSSRRLAGQRVRD